MFITDKALYYRALTKKAGDRLITESYT